MNALFPHVITSCFLSKVNRVIQSSLSPITTKNHLNNHLLENPEKNSPSSSGLMYPPHSTSCTNTHTLSVLLTTPEKTRLLHIHDADPLPLIPENLLSPYLHLSLSLPTYTFPSPASSLSRVCKKEHILFLSSPQFRTMGERTGSGGALARACHSICARNRSVGTLAREREKEREREV